MPVELTGHQRRSAVICGSKIEFFEHGMQTDPRTGATRKREHAAFRCGIPLLPDQEFPGPARHFLIMVRRLGCLTVPRRQRRKAGNTPIGIYSAPKRHELLQARRIRRQQEPPFLRLGIHRNVETPRACFLECRQDAHHICISEMLHAARQLLDHVVSRLFHRTVQQVGGGGALGMTEPSPHQVATAPGPGERYIEQPDVFRQLFGPGCSAALLEEV